MLDPNTTRSQVGVLRRPSVLFQNSKLSAPASLLIVQEVGFTAGASDANDLDAPWKVSFQVPAAHGDAKKFRPWKRPLTTEKGMHDTMLNVNAPGSTRLRACRPRGRDCSRSCKVVEKQRPTADIEWKRIHECFGDTRHVRLTLHGSPPFQVYYHTQRDNKPAREFHKTFPNSRSELMLQPERCSHYMHTFLSMSDSNYQKVELNGPSVDQIGTGPWNLEGQIVSPKGSETLQIPGLKTPRVKLYVPIPREVDQEGGSFDIELMSRIMMVASGLFLCLELLRMSAESRLPCWIKNPLAFLCDSQAMELQPWKIKYRRSEVPSSLKSASLSSPNAQRNVKEAGLYEIVEAPRSSTTLTPETVATYSSHNWSHTILPHICQAIDDHIDLDLIGRAPFQIIYNITEDDQDGGTNILEQPTIQQHSGSHQVPAAHHYTLSQHKDEFIPRSQRLLFEQEVDGRPTARLRHNNRISHCLNDALVPRDSSTQDGLIEFQGTPPFEVQLSIKNLAASKAPRRT
ncbi:hypothetical protein FIBSPDRAFT_950540 [Athelia psychrophila]|uniref:Nucleoporin POM152 immunoglobulin-like domain-containing protein n=1 Tax=Athelia psychrophila TaxID=1759441 RepID=A0A166NMD4_9AGAM|nr:hypothetical protein FIBSPDRAFT_950540 [Fibularhizoctonia sp. CBS 109695]